MNEELNKKPQSAPLPAFIQAMLDEDEDEGGGVDDSGGSGLVPAALGG